MIGQKSPKLSSPAHVKMVQAIPRWTAFIDPGPDDGHCGLVLIKNGIRQPKEGEPCHAFWQPLTLPMLEAHDSFEYWCRRAAQGGTQRRVYIEEYRLYPQDANRQVGQEFLTSESIGAFRHIARRSGVPVVKLPAQVKQPIASMVKARHMPLIGSTEHARDAELLMWYVILQNDQLRKGTVG